MNRCEQLVQLSSNYAVVSHSYAAMSMMEHMRKGTKLDAFGLMTDMVIDAMEESIQNMINSQLKEIERLYNEPTR